MKKITLIIILFSFNVFAHEDKLEQMPLDYVPQQVIVESYKLNTERISHLRPDTRESFTDLYLKDHYVYLGNSYDGIRIIDTSTPSAPLEVGIFPKPNPDIVTLSNGITHSRYAGNPLILPADLVQTPDGILYIADYGYTRIIGFKQTLSSTEQLGAIFKVDSQNNITTLTQGSPLTHPLDLALDNSGNLIVSNASNGGAGIFKVDPKTGTTTTLLQHATITFPYGVAVASLGTIYFTQIGDYRIGRPSTLYKLTPSTGEFTPIVQGDLTSADPFAILTDITIDPSGNIVAIDPGIYPTNNKPKILTINPNTGQTTILSSDTKLHTPTKIAVDESGIITISDLHADPQALGITTGTIFQLDPETKILTTLATGKGVEAPFGLTLSETGTPIWTNISKRARIADIKVDDNIAIATNEGFTLPFIFDGGLLGIQIFDISNPENPVELSKYTNKLTARGVHNTYISNNHAYLISNSDGIYILDISNPRRPIEIGHWAIPETEQTFERWIIPHDISIAHNRAYIAYAEAGLRILDISNPRVPKLISSYTYPNGWTHGAEPSADGKYVYVTDEKPGGFMRIIDITDLSTPIEVGIYQSTNRVVSNGNVLSIHNVQVKGNLIYVGNYQDGFRVVDVSNPTQPAEVGAYLLSETYLNRLYNGAWSAIPHNGLVYLSDLEHGLFILQYQNPISPVADFDNDGQIDFADFLLFAQNFGKQQTDPAFDARFDLDENGRVGFEDFLAFVKAFGD